MARYTGPSCRQCRREGEKLFLKGDKCYGEKCPLVSRGTNAPGQHGMGRKKVSEYGIQLRAKQKTKRYYGLIEGQFHKYFEMATKQQGMAGENLLRILESRLDNFVYRLGFANSRKEARQLVVHNHFLVNGKKVNVPSYLLKAGDTVEISTNSRSSEKIKSVLEANASRPVPAWVNADKENFKGSVGHLPGREEIDFDVAEHLIVELYSK